ncbi:MAG TPA: NADH-ubiquinone oxidoreductase-F iron-sulfur binding region domain-containing protein [Acidimicrobiia bacterium]
MPTLVMSRDDSEEHTRRGRVARRVPVGLPRLLDGYRPGVTMDLRAHLAHYGSPPWRGMTRRGPGPLVHTIEHAGLRGRGGAAFPTARKVRTVSDHGGWPVVVANGAEGEPASQKDKLLLCALPHLVLDGAALLAEAVGASEVIVAVERPVRAARVAVETAIRARAAAELDPVPFRLLAVPGRYVAGEATALVNFVNTGVAKPTFVPPRVSERGVGGRPTLVQNVETLAHVALIARYGADWFRQLGTSDEPGSALVTVGGSVAHPGVLEVAFGTPLGSAVMAAGGPTSELSAVLVGGYYGTWLHAAAAWDLPLTDAALHEVGGALGCGLVYAFPAASCGLAASAQIARYLADESAGQCGPCLYGLAALADTLAHVARGVPDRHTLGRLEELCDQVEGRGACHYPDGVVGFVRSARTVFAAEISRHRRDGGCRAAPPPSLLLPDATRERGWQ